MNNEGDRMKFCSKCKVSLNDKNDKCILCSSHLNNGSTDTVFPYVPMVYKEYQLFFKLLLIISFVCCSGCAFINFLISKKISWSLFVILGFICLLILLRNAISKRYAFPKKILSQVVIISLLSFIWDYFTGWHLWSISFVIPIVCSIASIDMVIIVKLLRLYIEDYLVYFLFVALFGFVPILFILFNLVSTNYPSYICIFLNFLSFVILSVLNFEDVISELKRRLHI